MLRDNDKFLRKTAKKLHTDFLPAYCKDVNHSFITVFRLAFSTLFSIINSQV